MERKADYFAQIKDTTSYKLKEARKKKKKRLDEIMGEMGHNRSGKYGK